MEFPMSKRIAPALLLMLTSAAAHADSGAPVNPACDDSTTYSVVNIKILDSSGKLDKPAPCVTEGHTSNGCLRMPVGRGRQPSQMMTPSPRFLMGTPSIKTGAPPIMIM
jgi:hypothetical protein